MKVYHSLSHSPEVITVNSLCILANVCMYIYKCMYVYIYIIFITYKGLHIILQLFLSLSNTSCGNIKYKIYTTNSCF